jgi:hypothetical protein
MVDMVNFLTWAWEWWCEPMMTTRREVREAVQRAESEP